MTLNSGFWMGQVIESYTSEFRVWMGQVIESYTTEFRVWMGQVIESYTSEFLTCHFLLAVSRTEAVSCIVREI